MNAELKKLIALKTETPSTKEINWNERRDQYIAAVNQLYDQITAFLAEPLKNQLVQLLRHPKTLTENYIGSYSINDLALIIGNEQVRFSPRGRNIVGADGRVDVVGERAMVALLLTPKSGWVVLVSRQPFIQTYPLTESTFAELLQLVMRD